MPGTPAPAAVLGDALYCLGLGLALAAAHGGLELAFGRGPLRCFVWDLAAGTAAAVLLCGFAAGASASGVPRWYMAAGLCAGALAWRAAVYGALRRAQGALRRAVLAPLRRLRAAAPARGGKKTGKSRRNAENQKKVLQNDRKILYN